MRSLLLSEGGWHRGPPLLLGVHLLDLLLLGDLLGDLLRRWSII